MAAPRKSRLFGGSFFPISDPKESFLASDSTYNYDVFTGIGGRKKWEENPRLIFDYGPDTYNGLLAHRKVKIAPMAEYLQIKYPDIDVFYHPVTEFDLLTVRFEGSPILTSRLSSLDRSFSGRVVREIEKVLFRYEQNPDLIESPFRDPMTLMTHNLDVDYEYPWYRTPICRLKQPSSKQQKSKVRVSFTQSIVGQCMVRLDENSSLWDKYLDKVKRSPGFEELLSREFFPGLKKNRNTNSNHLSTDESIRAEGSDTIS